MFKTERKAEAALLNEMTASLPSGSPQVKAPGISGFLFKHSNKKAKARSENVIRYTCQAHQATPPPRKVPQAMQKTGKNPQNAGCPIAIHADCTTQDFYKICKCLIYNDFIR